LNYLITQSRFLLLLLLLLFLSLSDIKHKTCSNIEIEKPI